MKAAPAKPVASGTLADFDHGSVCEVALADTWLIIRISWWYRDGEPRREFAAVRRRVRHKRWDRHGFEYVAECGDLETLAGSTPARAVA